MNHRKRNLLICVYLVSMTAFCAYAQEPNIASLIGQLEHKEGTVQKQTLKSLVEIGDKALPQLMENALTESSLGRMYHPVPDLAPRDTETTKVSQKIRYGCAKALVLMGKPAVPALIEALSDDNPVYRENAIILLARMGEPALTALTKALDNENALVRLNAQTSIGFMMIFSRPTLQPFAAEHPEMIALTQAPKKDIVRAIIKGLTDEDEKVRRKAILDCSYNGEVAPEVIPVLIRLLYYGSPIYSQEATSVLLLNMGEKGRKALTEALNNGPWNLRFGVALAYGHQFVWWVNGAHIPEDYEIPLPPEGYEMGALPGAVVEMLAEGQTHPDKVSQEESVKLLLELKKCDIDEAEKVLSAFPPLAITDGTVADGGVMYIDRDIPDRITFKFNHFIYGKKQITIQEVGGEPLGWSKHWQRDSVTITPPKGKRLKIGTYTITLREFFDIAGNKLDTKITFQTGIFPIPYFAPSQD